MKKKREVTEETKKKMAEAAIKRWLRMTEEAKKARGQLISASQRRRWREMNEEAKKLIGKRISKGKRKGKTSEQAK